VYYSGWHFPQWFTGINQTWVSTVCWVHSVIRMTMSDFVNSDQIKPEDFSCVKAIVSACAPLGESWETQIANKFPGTKLLQNYGLTGCFTYGSTINMKYSKPGSFQWNLTIQNYLDIRRCIIIYFVVDHSRRCRCLCSRYLCKTNWYINWLRPRTEQARRTFVNGQPGEWILKAGQNLNLLKFWKWMCTQLWFFLCGSK